jgi:phosphopentomutase
MSWTVQMWHFGKDALISYSGQKFEVTWENSLNFFRIYSKEYVNKKMKVRKEVQEYPNKSLEESFMDKLKDDKENTFVVGV